MPLTINEQLLYTTVHLEARGPGFVADGTGFFFEFNLDRGVAPALVTNKHVIEDATSLILTVHLSDGATPPQPIARTMELKINLFAEAQVTHPDPDVDIVAISLEWHKVKENAGCQPYALFMDESAILPVTEWPLLDAFEDVTMIGCPNGLFDTVNHMPLARRGITSTRPILDYEGRPEFLIDAACFHGSSGSPVFLTEKAISRSRAGQVTMGGTRTWLLGLLYAGPVITLEGEIVWTTHAKRGRKVQIETMMHLGRVIKATELLALQSELNRLTIERDLRPVSLEGTE